MSNGEGRLIAGRYRLGPAIGRGGMGIVWRARDEVLHRDVAVKEIKLPPGLEDHERAVLCERTMREARSAARVRHEAIVDIYDVVSEDDRPWIVMELVDSRNLEQVVKDQGPLPPGRVAEIGRSLLAALGAAHAAGVLHRDVKPGNVLLAAGGRVVLTDFGLAVIDGSTALTQTGIFMGSPAYVAPEVAQGEKATTRSDLWSLGATLYAAVEGRSPYGRESLMATLGALLTEKPDPAQRPGPLRPVLDGLLRKDPKARLAPEAVGRLLDGVLAGPRSRRRLLSRRYVLGGVAAAVTATLVATTAWALSPEDDPKATLEPGLKVANVTPDARETGGTGMPITVTFNRAVKDRARAERVLRVHSVKPNTGAWKWISSAQAVFRTARYWQPNQEVSVAVPGLTHRFTIGDEHLIRIDVRARLLFAYSSGVVIAKAPITAGRAGSTEWTTISGRHLVMGTTRSATLTPPGLKRGEPGWYTVRLNDAVRLSGTASYIHAKPDAIGDLGKINGTHGTVGAAPEIARRLFGWAYRGDVVEIVGTQRKLEWFNGWGYWQVPWQQWAAGRQTYPT